MRHYSDTSVLLVRCDRAGLRLGLGSCILSRFKTLLLHPTIPPSPPLVARRAAGRWGGCTLDATGLNTVHTPSFTTHLSEDYVNPTQVGPFDIAADFYHNDGFYWDPANQLRQPTYSLYNASIGWTHPADRFGIRLWARNLGGAKYYSNASTSTLGELFSPAPPRTYGATISARF
jgi:iron complex outermembrane recepter protein